MRRSTLLLAAALSVAALPAPAPRQTGRSRSYQVGKLPGPETPHPYARVHTHRDMGAYVPARKGGVHPETGTTGTVRRPPHGVRIRPPASGELLDFGRGKS